MNAMPRLETPSLADLFGAADLTVDAMLDQVKKTDSLEKADRLLLCPDLPKTVQKQANAHIRVMQKVQAAAGDGRRLRELLVSREVAQRPGAVQFCRRLIREAP